MNIEDLYKIYLQHPSVETDTRKLKKGDIFFALKGPNFNGNAFAQQAIDSGAVCAVIDEKEFEIPHKTFLVTDVLTTLQQLAHHHRAQLHIPVIAITGSNGKTTTKELIHAVLRSAYKVYTTEGNLNNHIGIPLTLLKIQTDAEVAVVEMGANHAKEIEGYCQVVLPTHGLITNCGKAHLEGFGSEEGVRRAKGELFDYLRERGDGTAFVMWDYDYLQTMSRGIHRVITYGTHDAEVTGSVVASQTFLHIAVEHKGEQIVLATQLVGAYNLPNVLAAVAVGREMRISMDKIKQAIEQYRPSNSRSQMVESGSNTFILDAYNANPSSMRLAVENFAAMNHPEKVLMLGSMAEMGAASEKEHEELVSLIGRYPWQDVILVGAPFEPYQETYRYFPKVADAAEWFNNQSFEHTWFLLKGSRSTQMEKILTETGKA